MLIKNNRWPGSGGVLEVAYPHLGNSEMLKHDAVYVIGQIKAKEQIPFLLMRMDDPGEQSVVRHEAAEALGNFPEEKEMIMERMRVHWDSSDQLLRSTVRVAIPKLTHYTKDSRYGQNRYGALEAAEPFSESEIRQFLQSKGYTIILKDPSSFYSAVESCVLRDFSEVDEWLKYRIIYYLRDTGGKQSQAVLCKLLSPMHRTVTSALMRHEVCIVFSQIHEGDYFVQYILQQTSRDETEHPIVRHEAILAYFDITEDRDFIEEFKESPLQLIRESVEIAVGNCVEPKLREQGGDRDE